MTKQTMRGKRWNREGCAAALGLAAALMIAACGGGNAVPDGGLRVPRGATLSVRISQPLSPASHSAGQTFAATLDAPLEKGAKIFVPAGARVEGVVEATPRDDAGRRGLTLRLVRLYLDEQQFLEMETDPVTRFPRDQRAVTENVNALLGLEDKIAYLAETGGGAREPAGGAAPQAGAPLVPMGSLMVFTLASDLVVPPPGQ